MTWNTLDDLDLQGRIVLTRVDINVPMEGGRVTDTTRIDRIVPTVTDILARGGKPVLLAHFGRPKGQVVAEMSLRHLVPALEAALARPVTFLDPADRAAIEATPEGTVILLENTRFSPEETDNAPALAARLAALGDIYCNDAFSAAHRAHASTEGVARLLPSCAGRLMAEELGALKAALGQPRRPVMAVVGGAKVSTKLELLENLTRKVDILVIGGGMANTFLAAQGIDVGRSLCEHDLADKALRIIEGARAAGCEILLPRDVVVAEDFAEGARHRVVAAGDVPPDTMILDAGPESVARILAALDSAATLIWNGPLGAFEIAPFDAATNAAAEAAAALTEAGRLMSVAGGGDTVAALNKTGSADRFSYLSTAGGAFLEWMEGKTLPGVAALMRD